MLSFTDLSLPQDFLNLLKSISEGRALDSLIHEIVLKNKRRATYTYTCRQCGFSFNKNSEEISCCTNCNSGELTTININLTFSKNPFPFSNTNSSIDCIYDAMVENYLNHTKEDLIPSDFFDCGWDSNGYAYASFKGGERAIAINPRICVLKASILVPYLYKGIDQPIDNDNNSKEEVQHLTPIFYSLVKSWT